MPPTAPASTSARTSLPVTRRKPLALAVARCMVLPLLLRRLRPAASATRCKAEYRIGILLLVRRHGVIERLGGGNELSQAGDMSLRDLLIGAQIIHGGHLPAGLPPPQV